LVDLFELYEFLEDCFVAELH